MRRRHLALLLLAVGCARDAGVQAVVVRTSADGSQRLAHDSLVLAADPGPGFRWAEIALDNGYADQAHLCRDVLRYTGHRPSDLLSGLRQQDPALWPFHVSPVTTQRWFGTQGY